VVTTNTAPTHENEKEGRRDDTGGREIGALRQKMEGGVAPSAI
jgi:hypothetical protein